MLTEHKHAIWKRISGVVNQHHLELWHGWGYIEIVCDGKTYRSVQGEHDLIFVCWEPYTVSPHYSNIPLDEDSAVHFVSGDLKPWADNRPSKEEVLKQQSDGQIMTLSEEFIRILHEWLHEDEIIDAVKRNKEETDPNVCHTHDFCDANMAMEEAFELVMGRESISRGTPEDFATIEADGDLVNAAWNLAKKNEFKL